MRCVRKTASVVSHVDDMMGIVNNSVVRRGHPGLQVESAVLHQHHPPCPLPVAQGHGCP